MKSEKNILIAFILNLLFSFFEFFGGFITGSSAILSDAVHDLGDAASIGVSWLLEKKSRRQADVEHSCGYIRYSVLGSLVTTFILILGSAAVVLSGIGRMISPIAIHYDGMILFAVVGVLINGFAAFFTREGDSLNQKAVNLHMMEDVLGWVVVLAGAVVMRFADIVWLDPVLSIAVAVYILIKALPNLKTVINLFLEKTPDDIHIPELMERLSSIEGIEEIHHIHIRSLDGYHHCANMHIVTQADPAPIKEKVRDVLMQYNIVHATLETEAEQCSRVHWLAVRPHHHGHMH